MAFLASELNNAGSYSWFNDRPRENRFTGRERAFSFGGRLRV